MLLMGIDIGTSSIKVAVVDAVTRECLATAQVPGQEAPITSLRPGWAEQSPESWWNYTCTAIGQLQASGKYDPGAVGAIGIAYQMHGLVIVDRQQRVLRDSIIWCDSRAVPYGESAFEQIGPNKCLSSLLNSPGNFTAAKLAWVKEQEPQIYERIDQVLLPGDFIAMKLTGRTTTSISALSEAVLWDFQQDSLSQEVLDYFGFDAALFPQVQPVFSEHGRLLHGVAQTLGLNAGIPITYKAGDQPNNALSLNVLRPGEVAATAGTSGVIYGVSNALTHDPQSRINSFAHVNYSLLKKSIGVLLCINGAGITSHWIRSLTGAAGYEGLNAAAASIPAGSEGLLLLPFGNGAERMLENRLVGAHLLNIDLNKHTAAHMYRAALEGIAFSFRYGLDIMRQNGMRPSVIRAGSANMFRSETFTETFVQATGVPVELYRNDGSAGAAMGAGIGAGIYASEEAAFSGLQPLMKVEPKSSTRHEEMYVRWKAELEARCAQAPQPAEALHVTTKKQ